MPRDQGRGLACLVSPELDEPEPLLVVEPLDVLPWLLVVPLFVPRVDGFSADDGDGSRV